MPNYVSPDGKIMLVCSLLSILSCLTILGTFFVFPKLFHKSYMVVIYAVTASDLLSAVGSAIGEPSDATAACWVQGILTNVFTLSSVMWTVVSVLMIYSIVAKNEVTNISISHHAVCWGLPLTVTLLPLINMRYGTDGPDWCWLVEIASSPSWALPVWSWINFYGVIWASLFADVAVFSVLFFAIYTNSQLRSRSSVKRIFNKLQLYPVIVAVCWGLTCFYDLTYTPGTLNTSEVYFDGIASALPCLQGFFSTVLFWYVNEDVRACWVRYIQTGKRLDSKSRFSSMLSKGQNYRSEVGGVSVVNPVDLTLRQSRSGPRVSARISARVHPSGSSGVGVPPVVDDQELEILNEGMGGYLDIPDTFLPGGSLKGDNAFGILTPDPLQYVEDQLHFSVDEVLGYEESSSVENTTYRGGIEPAPDL